MILDAYLATLGALLAVATVVAVVAALVGLGRLIGVRVMRSRPALRARANLSSRRIWRELAHEARPSRP